jgi:hypothetical protein
VGLFDGLFRGGDPDAYDADVDSDYEPGRPPPAPESDPEPDPEPGPDDDGGYRVYGLDGVDYTTQIIPPYVFGEDDDDDW